jgi:hypothetical protein
MNPATSTMLPRKRPMLIAFALVAAAGLAAGSFIRPTQGPAFEYAYALIEPACLGTMCVGLLRRRPDHARWLVPLLLIGVMLNVANRPSTPALTAIGFAAGMLAIIGALRGHRRSATAATLVCCASLASSLLAGLLDRG